MGSHRVLVTGSQSAIHGNSHAIVIFERTLINLSLYRRITSCWTGPATKGQ